MAEQKRVLACLLFMWLACVEVRGFVVFNDGGSRGTDRYFRKDAGSRAPVFSADKHISSGEQVGSLFVWQDQAIRSLGNFSGRGLSSFQSKQRGHDYSEDSGWMNVQRLREQRQGVNPMSTVERLIGMNPKVDCDGDLMRLTVRGQEALFGSNFLIDRGSLPPLPLSQLPSECGHRFQRTWRDLAFSMPIDGCYVSQERDAFVLPLLWWGLPVKMSCSSHNFELNAPTVSCYTNGMIVKLHNEVSENLMIKVGEEWLPVLKASAKCGYSLVSHPGGTVIHATYIPCTEPKDGMYTLSMAVDHIFNLSCPETSLGLSVGVPDSSIVPPTIPPTTVTAITPTPTISETTRPILSNPIIQRFPVPQMSSIPKFPYFKPVPQSPNLLYTNNVPPTPLPQKPNMFAPHIPMTQRGQPPVNPNYPQSWSSCNQKSCMIFNPDSRLGNSFFTATMATQTPLSALQTPTVIPPDQFILPGRWPTKFSRGDSASPLHPQKHGYAAPNLQDHHWPHPAQTASKPSDSKASLRTDSAQSVGSSTWMRQPLLQDLWYKQSALLGVPPLPTEVPQNVLVSTPVPIASFFPYKFGKTETSKPQAHALPFQSAKAPPQSLNVNPSGHSSSSLKQDSSLHINSATWMGQPHLKHLWYKPSSAQTEVPTLPTVVPQNVAVAATQTIDSFSRNRFEKPEEISKHQFHTFSFQSVKAEPISSNFDPSTYSSVAPPKFPEYAAHAPLDAPHTAVNLSHSHSVQCLTICPGSSSVFYHHPEDKPFGKPIQVSSLGVSSIRNNGEYLKSQLSSKSNEFPIVQAMDYNQGPFSSGNVASPLSSKIETANLLASPISKDSTGPDSSKLSTRPTMCPFLLRKLYANAAISAPQSKMQPVQPFRRDPQPLRSSHMYNIDGTLGQSANQFHRPELPWIPSFSHQSPSVAAPPKTVSKSLVNHDPSGHPVKDREFWRSVPIPSSDHAYNFPTHQLVQGHTKNPFLPNSNRFLQIHEPVSVVNPQLYHHGADSVAAPVFNHAKLNWVPSKYSPTT